MSSKGQLTVPKEVRHRLGLKEGDKVEFYFDQGVTIVRPVRPATNPFEEFIGAIPAFKDKEEVNAWVRELRSEDEGG